MAKTINERKSKVVIYSFTPLSQQVAKTLQKKFYKILIIEEDTKQAQQARDMGFEVESYSLLDDNNIIKAGICHTNIKAFFCLSDNNNNNLFVTLSVRNLNKNIQIISLSSDNQTDKAMFLAGANKVINPYDIGATRIARLLHKPKILKVLDDILFKDTDIDVEEITIKKNSIFDGVYINDLKQIENKDIIILGIQDKEISDNFIFLTSGINHKIDEGDTLVILGTFYHISKFKRSFKRII